MYKPRTIAQFRVMEFLKSSFVLEDCLVSPISLNGLMLEDRTMDRIAFICCDDRIWESTIPVPAGRNSVRIFSSCLCLTYPRAEQQTFEAKTTLWLDHTGLLTYQQALGLPDDLFRHYLRCGVPTEEEVRRLAAQGGVSDEEYQSIFLWYLNGNSARNHLCVTGVDSAGTCMDLVFNYNQPEKEHFQFYRGESEYDDCCGAEEYGTGRDRVS